MTTQIINFLDYEKRLQDRVWYQHNYTQFSGKDSSMIDSIDSEK